MTQNGISTMTANLPEQILSVNLQGFLPLVVIFLTLLNGLETTSTTQR